MKVSTGRGFRGTSGITQMTSGKSSRKLVSKRPSGVVTSQLLLSRETAAGSAVHTGSTGQAVLRSCQRHLTADNPFGPIANRSLKDQGVLFGIQQGDPGPVGIDSFICSESHSSARLASSRRATFCVGCCTHQRSLR